MKLALASVPVEAPKADGEVTPRSHETTPRSQRSTPRPAALLTANERALVDDRRVASLTRSIKVRSELLLRAAEAVGVRPRHATAVQRAIAELTEALSGTPLATRDALGSYLFHRLSIGRLPHVKSFDPEKADPHHRVPKVVYVQSALNGIAAEMVSLTEAAFAGKYRHAAVMHSDVAAHQLFAEALSVAESPAVEAIATALSGRTSGSETVGDRFRKFAESQEVVLFPRDMLRCVASFPDPFGARVFLCADALNDPTLARCAMLHALGSNFVSWLRKQLEASSGTLPDALPCESYPSLTITFAQEAVPVDPGLFLAYHSVSSFAAQLSELAEIDPQATLHFGPFGPWCPMMFAAGGATQSHS